MLAWRRTSDSLWEERHLRDVVEQCLRESWSRLFGYAVSLCGDRETARDLIQSSAVKALDTNAPPREPAAARAWLFRVMRNDWIDRGRRATVRAADREPVEPTEGPWAYEGHRVIVVTSRPIEQPKGALEVRADLDLLIEELRALNDGDVWMLGGGRLQMAFMERGALDEIEIYVIPEILGSGQPLFPLTGYQASPTLVNATAIDKGCVRLHYRFS